MDEILLEQKDSTEFLKLSLEHDALEIVCTRRRHCERWVRNETASSKILNGFFFGARDMRRAARYYLFSPRLFIGSCLLSIFRIPLRIGNILASADSFSA